MISHQQQTTQSKLVDFTDMKRILALSLAFYISSFATAQQPEEIIVIGIVPAGSSVEAAKFAYPIQSANANDLEDAAVISIADFLRQNFSSISLNLSLSIL